MREADWEKVRFPYRKDKKKEKNFEKFLKIGGYDQMIDFNYGNNFHWVARGINPRYNPNAKENDTMFPTNLLSHLKIFRSYDNYETVLVAQPYFTTKRLTKIDKNSKEYEGLKKFCEHYAVKYKELSPKQSFYTSEYPTRLIVIGIPDALDRFKQRR